MKSNIIVLAAYRKPHSLFMAIWSHEAISQKRHLSPMMIEALARSVLRRTA